MTKSIISYLPLLCIVAGVIYTSSINTGAEQKQAAASNQTDIIESSPDINEIQDRIDKRKQDLIEDSKEEEIEELKAKIKSLDSKVSQLQNDDNVEQDKTKALELDPEENLTYFDRGIAKIELKDYSGAIADFTKAIALDPKDTDSYYFRGEAKRKLEEYSGAIADYTKAIELGTIKSAYFWRAYSKNEIENYSGAVVDYTKAIKLDPEEYFSYLNRGATKTWLDDNYGAIADFNICVRLDPDNSLAYLYRGDALNNEGFTTTACENWRKAAELGNTEAGEQIKDYCD